MLDALGPEDRAFYELEANVILGGTSAVIQEEIESQYAFIGGE